jgi:20S proteasome alpha/beta subunit
MGGDRAISDSNGYITRSAHPKVFRRYQYLFGYAGSVKFGKLIEHGFEPPTYRGEDADGELDEFMNTDFVEALSAFLEEKTFSMFDDKPEIGASTSGLLVGIEGRIFEIEYELAAIEFADNYAAIGSATEFAIGALATHKNIYGKKYLKNNITNALKVAAKHSTTCSEPFDIVMIGEGND